MIQLLILLVGDSSGKLVTITDEVITGEIIIATSPESVEDATVTVLIDDGERGEIWIAGTTLIDRFDKKEKTLERNYRYPRITQ